MYFWYVVLETFIVFDLGDGVAFCVFEVVKALFEFGWVDRGDLGESSDGRWQKDE